VLFVSRGLTDDVVDVPDEAPASTNDIMEVVLSIFFGVEALNRKLDAVLVAVQLQEEPNE
jgi:hypothetical protein